MSTFLTVVGVFFVVVLFICVVAYFKIKRFLAAKAVVLVKKGAEALVDSAKADYVSDELRAKVANFKQRADALPAEVGYFSAGTVGKTCVEMLKEAVRLTAALAEAEQKSKPPVVIDAEATVVNSDGSSQTPLLLTDGSEARTTDGTTLAPTEVATTAPENPEAILAAFKAEWVKEGTGVADAWLDARTGDVFIWYQLELSVADKVMENPDAMPKVPVEYRGLPTLITWFPREN